MKNNELSLVEIQKEMLNTAIKIDEICSELNIKYTLSFGSLLGAIRHNGFIPWDDDLDIWMTKSDLDVFAEYCEKNAEKIKPFKLCTRKNVNNYTYNIPRFANFDYKYVNTDSHQAMFDIGIFVDIYPIDGYGNSKETVNKMSHESKKLNCLYDIYINPNSRTSFINTIVKKCISFVLHLIYKDKYYLIQEKKFDKLISKYSSNDSKYVGSVRWEPGVPILHKRSDIFDENGQFNVIRHKFENVELYILKNYDVTLRKSYGDYMCLPPEDQRNPHHDYKVYKR